MIDTAQVYDNHREIGEGIRRALEDGLVAREDLFVVSKVWMTFYSSRVREAVELMLEELGLEYVDCVLLHWPFALKANPEDAFDYFPEGLLGSFILWHSCYCSFSLSFSVFGRGGRL